MDWKRIMKGAVPLLLVILSAAVLGGGLGWQAGRDDLCSSSNGTILSTGHCVIDKCVKDLIFCQDDIDDQYYVTWNFTPDLTK